MSCSPMRFLAGLALASAALAPAAGAQTIPLRAFLSGAFETPVNASTATGSASMTYDVGTGMLTYSVSVTGLVATQAHIHTGGPGIAGGILIVLAGGPTFYSGSAPVLAGSLSALLHEGLYVNVHTVAFPGGEIRGQIRVPTEYFSLLDAAKEVPPTPSLATGRAQLHLNQPAGTLTYTMNLTGLSATVAHIHDGVAGINGPILFALAGGPTTFTGTTAALSTPQLLDLMTKGLYLNAHSVAFPGGEIRDQIHIGGLNSSGLQVARTNGGSIQFGLDAPAADAGMLYLLLGSLSGTSPGFPSGSWVLPLNFDSYFSLTLNNPNQPPWAMSFSFLNASAQASATFTYPPLAGPGLVGKTANHAYAVVDIFGSGAVVFTSAPVPLTILP